jgi:hypothetical protein
VVAIAMDAADADLVERLVAKGKLPAITAPRATGV